MIQTSSTYTRHRAAPQSVLERDESDVELQKVRQVKGHIVGDRSNISSRRKGASSPVLNGVSVDHGVAADPSTRQTKGGRNRMRRLIPRRKNRAGTYLFGFSTGTPLVSYIIIAALILMCGWMYSLFLLIHRGHTNYGANEWDKYSLDIYGDDQELRQMPPFSARTVFLVSDPVRPQSRKVFDAMCQVTPGEEAPEQLERQPYVQGNCVPMEEWQVTSFPNCNTVHELDVMAAGKNSTVGLPGTDKSSDSGYKIAEDNIFQLARGWFRHTWRVDTGSVQESFVLKTLRMEREFYDEYYDLHRRDAMAMERLTASPFVMNVYGYCGQSAVNELAGFFDGFTNLQAFAKQLRGRNEPKITRMKLQISAMLALGVAHMHEIDGDGDNATMVHYDINPKNVAIVKGGKPKLNDFNVAEFMRWDVVKNERCGFKGRLHEPWWRAPEELVMVKPDDKERMITSEGYVDLEDDLPALTEKIDVYSLGNLIYYMLTGHSPRGQTVKSRLPEVREAVLKGEPPKIDAYYLDATDPALVAMRRAVRRCFQKNPEDRWPARDIADELLEALHEIKKDPS